MKYSVLWLTLAASVLRTGFSACVTDGGYAEQGTACASVCFPFPLSEKIPYIGPNTPPNEPTNATTDTFCTTVPISEYNPIEGPERKFWGFCLCSTEEPTEDNSTEYEDNSTEYEEVWVADGGGVGLNHPENVDEDGYQDCMLPFTYIDEAGNQLVVEECAEISELPPFLTPSGDFPYSPLGSETNTSLWCPINSDVYEVSAESGEESKQKDWGYCLLTLREVNADPNSTATESPTPFPTFSDDYYSDDNETEANTTYSPTALDASPASATMQAKTMRLLLTLLFFTTAFIVV